MRATDSCRQIDRGILTSEETLDRIQVGARIDRDQSPLEKYALGTKLY